MKKIKYLLGLSIIGLGLLFNHVSAFCSSQQRFSPFYHFDLVTIPFSSSTSYQQHSSKLFTVYGIDSVNGSNFLSSSFFQDGINQGLTTGIYSTFNSSYLGYVEKIGFNPSSVTCYNSNNNGSLAFYHGLGSDMTQLGFGAYFSDRTNTGNIGPVFLFGNQYFSLTSNYRFYKRDNLPSTYYRIFYNQPANLSDPVSNINLFNISSNTPFFARQYFTDYGFSYMYSGSASAYSDSKIFRDLGSQYNKSFNIGGYGMGYSYVVNTIGQNSLRWEDFSFVSVGSRCLQNLMQLGMSDPNSGTSSGCQQVGLFVLKGDSYVSKNNNASAIVLSKDPSDKSKILYQLFDCAEDSILRLFDDNYCSSISHGYIEVDGSSNVLPFGSGSFYSIGSGNKFLDTLFYNDPDYGYISIESNQYCLHSDSDSFCFSLVRTLNNKSLKEYYLEGSIQGIPTITNAQDITQTMINNCKGPFYNTPDGLPPAYCNTIGTNFSGNFYQDISVDESGNIVISIIQGNPDDTINLSQTTFVIDENGNYVATCSGDCNGSYVYYGQLTHTLDSTGYYLGYFNKTGRFFQCPYSYTQRIVIGKKLMSWLGGYDPFLPINCAIASYIKGTEYLFFNNSGLNLIQSGPLIKGNSQSHIVFFRFLDFIMCIGIFFFFRFIGKLLDS